MPTSGAPSFASGAVSIAISPDDGTAQLPNSIQVASDAKLTLRWEATGADSVSIDPGDTGLPAKGTKDIPSEDASYTLTAVAADGTQSDSFTIEVHTHEPGQVVSSHAELHPGETTTQAPSSSTTQSPAITTTASPASTTTAPASTTTAPASTTTAPASTTSVPPTTTTAPPSTTTAAPSTTTTAAPGTTTTHAPSTTTTHSPSTTTTSGQDLQVDSFTVEWEGAGGGSGDPGAGAGN